MTQAVPKRSRLRRKATRVALRLHEIYGSPRHGNKDDPLDELIFIILSQMTTHQSFNRVYDRLQATAGAWEGVLRMPLHRLESSIKDAGLSHQKGPRIKAILKKVQRDFGRLSLDSLGKLDDGALERYLLGLPGVGVKTAKCVMMYSLGRSVLPVDTQVWRVARRLGLVKPETPRSAVHDRLESVVPPGHRYSFHVNSLSHGRQVCRPSRPRCRRCRLIRMCAYPST